MAGRARSKFSKSTTFLRVAYSAPKLSVSTAYSAPKLSESTVEGIRRLTLPATKALPFIKLKANDQPLWRPESFWNVEPTGKRETDVRLGRQYAREAIAAMKADHNCHLLSYIIQDVIKDALQRGGDKGGTRRNAIVVGFLSEISEAIAAARS